MVKRILFYSDYIAQILAVQTITLTVGHPVLLSQRKNITFYASFSLNCASVLYTFWDLFSRVLWEKGDYKMLMNLEEEGVKLGRAGKWIECEEND